MIPDDNLIENGLLIVTGSTLRAEQEDRPLAYRLKTWVEEHFNQSDPGFTVVVLCDLWYLNAEVLQRLPAISIGCPSVNAVSAYLYKRLDSSLIVDDTLMIQMDPHFQDLRVSVWGKDHQMTQAALDLFIEKGHLSRFLEAVSHRRD